MTICTVTCHDVYNHGASLQAYALLTYLNRMGHQAFILDYKPEYLSRHFRILLVDSPRWRANVFLKCAYLVLKVPGRLASLPRKWAFDRFTREYLTLTCKRYASNDELKRDPPIADAYVCGSDQIWNSNLPNGRDPAFYLDFAPTGAKKVSYAASFAMDYIPDELKCELRGRIEKIDHISVRESGALNLLRDIGIDRGAHVLDPVFLIDKGEWEKMAAPVSAKKYVLICCFDNERVVLETARGVASSLNCGVNAVGGRPIAGVDKNCRFVSPERFLGLIKNAQYLVTNSFHALAFAVIFHVPFTVLGRAEKLNSRMTDLLRSLGLDNRYVTQPERQSVILPPVDFDDIDRKVDALRQYSKRFLAESLST